MNMNQTKTPLLTHKWLLDGNIKYLNHGSFGARTECIRQAQQHYRDLLEASPVDFLDRRASGYLDRSREALGHFLALDPMGFGFVDNATTGISSAIHSLPLAATDEILTTNHVYNGVRQLLIKRARDVGCSYREVEVSFPSPSPTELASVIIDAITPNVKVLVVDHVSSATALIFPIQELIQACKDRDVLIIVDGAHAPGMLPFNEWDAYPDWYVGNLHKWLCAPLGAAFVWSSKKRRPQTHPLTISHFLDQSYLEEFDWQGTKDISPWLTVYDAVKRLTPEEWVLQMKHNHQLAIAFENAWLDAFGLDSMYCSNDQFGSIVTVRLPMPNISTLEEADAFRDKLYEEHKVEIPVFLFENTLFTRFSGQAYVQLDWIEQYIDIIKV